MVKRIENFLEINWQLFYLTVIVVVVIGLLMNAYFVVEVRGDVGPGEYKIVAYSPKLEVKMLGESSGSVFMDLDTATTCEVRLLDCRGDLNQCEAELDTWRLTGALSNFKWFQGLHPIAQIAIRGGLYTVTAVGVFIASGGAF